MEIRELVLHPAQLREVELVKVTCDKTEQYNAENAEINISVNVESEIGKSGEGKTKVEILIEGEGFNIQVAEIGIFTFEGIEDSEKIKLFLEVQGIRLMWSYIRETIYDFSGKLLRKPIMLPTIDVLKTIENTEERK